MAKNPKAPIIQSGDARVTGQLQAGSVAVNNVVLSTHEGQLSADGVLIEALSNRNEVGGYAGLDETGKILSSAVPAIGITSVRVVDDEEEQLELEAGEGDVVLRTDISRSFIHNGGTTGTVADYTELLVPPNLVQSVAGRTGAIVLLTSDVVGLDSALGDKAALSHGHQISEILNLQTALDGKVSTNDSRLTDARTPTGHKTSHASGGSDALAPGDIGAAPASHTHTLAEISGAGSAASKDAPGSGNASGTEVVLGSDTRLSNSRTPTAHTHEQGDVTGLTDSLSGKEDKSAKNAASGYAGLNSEGKLSTSTLPPLAITSVQVATNEVAHLALGCQEGDVVVRTDQSKTYIHNGGTAGTLADFTELVAAPGSLVQSVAGKTGTVTLALEDVEGLEAALDAAGNVDSVAGKTGTVTLDVNDVSGLQTALDGKAASSHSHALSDVTNLQTSLDGKAASSHSHTISDVTNLQTSLDGKASSSHTHAIANVTNLQTSLDGKAASSHTHAISDVTNLQTALDGKAASSHSHTLANITDAGTAAAKNIPASGNASSTEVVYGSDTRLTNTRTPTAHKSTHILGGSDAISASDISAAPANHYHTLTSITDAGTAASKSVPTSGNATSTQVVLGSDTRLTDARTPTSHTHSQSDITGLTSALSDVNTALDGKQSTSAKNANNGYAGLNSSGKLSSSVLPTLNITSVEVVASETTQLALSASEGDVAVRTDESKTYIHNGGTAGTMADWTELVGAENLVQSVAGKTGTVTLTTSDITDAGTAATKNVPSSGNASSTQVVLGNDTRLSDSRTPTSHTHTLSAITDAGTAAAKNVPTSGNASSTQVAMGNDTRFYAPGIYAWGLNDNAQCGDGTRLGYLPYAQLISSGTDWSWVSAGMQASYAIKTDGTLWSWGSRSYGQLGDGETSGWTYTPTKVGTDTNWKTVGSGQYFAIALKTDGTLWSWGERSSGKLGDGSSNGNGTTPAKVGTATNWEAIACGDVHALALKTDGTLWAWGYNANGQLGDNSTTQRSSPVQIGSDTNWTAISAGTSFSVALKSDGTLWTWGSTASGRLGNNTTTGNVLVPTKIGTDTDWSAISAGNNWTLALKTDGSIWAWGTGSGYAVLTNTGANVLVPTKGKTADTGWTYICGVMTNCAAGIFNGQFRVWGNHGSLGLSVSTGTSQAAPIANPFLKGTPTVVTRGATSSHALVIVT